MKVDVMEELQRLEDRKQLNKASLSELEFYVGDHKQEIDPSVLEEWNYIGLNNTDFISHYFGEGSGNITIMRILKRD